MSEEKQTKKSRLALKLEKVEVTMLEPSRTDTVLDLGTATGNVAIALSEGVKEVFASDLDIAMLGKYGANIEEKGIRNITLYQGTADNLPFEDRFFDIANCSAVFHHSQTRRRYRSRCTGFLKTTASFACLTHSSWDIQRGSGSHWQKCARAISIASTHITNI